MFIKKFRDCRITNNKFITIDNFTFTLLISLLTNNYYRDTDKFLIETFVVHVKMKLIYIKCNKYVLLLEILDIFM